MDKTSLGDRMKEYENTTRYILPKRTYTLIRVDGKAFHTFTKQFERPYSYDLAALMNRAAWELCDKIQGAKFAYVQSDEISVVLTDFDKLTTNAWFNRDLRKQTSVSASIATAAFNRLFFRDYVPDDEDSDPAMFDSRVWTISERVEVYNYFLWRQRDAERNSIQMLAQSLYSHKECFKKNTSELQDMCHAKGRNWNDEDTQFKRGRCIVKETYDVAGTERSRWTVDNEIPVFSQNPEYIFSRLPEYQDFEGKKDEN